MVRIVWMVALQDSAKVRVRRVEKRILFADGGTEGKRRGGPWYEEDAGSVASILERSFHASAHYYPKRTPGLSSRPVVLHAHDTVPGKRKHERSRLMAPSSGRCGS